VEYTEECENKIIKLMEHKKTVAFGEIGLDYHIFENEKYADPPLQKTIFEKQVICNIFCNVNLQMNHALSLKKPIIIHTREAGI
jgi:TatD DNase family protein